MNPTNTSQENFSLSAVIKAQKEKDISAKISPTLEKGMIEVSDNKYRIKKLGSQEGMIFLEGLIKTFAPAAGSAIDAIQAQARGEGNESFMLELFSVFSSRLSGTVIVEFVFALLKDLEVNGTQLTLEQVDEHFAGRYKDLMTVAKFAFEENFKESFFENGWQGALINLSNLPANLMMPISNVSDQL